MCELQDCKNSFPSASGGPPGILIWESLDQSVCATGNLSAKLIYL